MAWISLEGSDNDPLRFWRYVITACQVFHPTVAHAALAQLKSAWQISRELFSQEAILTTLLNDMARLACTGLLVLEDYHVVTEQAIHDMMIFFLDHLPADMHIILLTRSEPPFPLSRWRARGDLCEIRAADLRFSPEEMTLFFQQVLASSQSMLTAEMLKQLDRRVEGWAAGLRFLALALKGNQQVQALEHVIADFTGDYRTIQDYFVSEVFGELPETLQLFLLQTSVLSRLTGDLCDAVTGKRDSTRLLRTVERAGIFLEPLDETGQWYRYHALFSEAMRVEARQRLGTAAFLALYMRASQWYEQQEMLSEAIEAAFQARDNQRAVELIERLVRGSQYFLLNPQIFLATQGFYTFRRWLDQLPDEALYARPLLCLGYATATLFVFVTDQIFPSWNFIARVERALEMAEAGFRREGNSTGLGEVFAFRALVLRDQGALDEAVHFALLALDYLPENHREGRNFSLSVLGTGKLFDGQLEEAHKIFLELYALCEVLGNNALTRANAAMLHVVTFERGELHRAEEFFRQMLAEARRENDRDDIAHAQLFLAQIHYEWNDLQLADQEAGEALELGQYLGNEEFQMQAALLQARIEQARGSTEIALQRCAQLFTRFPATTPLRRRFWREIATVQARFYLAAGDFSALQRWEKERLQEGERVFLLQREREGVMQARWLHAQEKAGEAQRLLEDLLQSALEAGRFRSVLEMRALLISIKIPLGQIVDARQALLELLAQAHPQGFLRLFLDEGESMLRLLRGLLPSLRTQSLSRYLQTILHAAPVQVGLSSSSPSLLPTPLSLQEQQVLRLLVAGKSNPQIARELIVSINTVKAHVQSIYRKLQVNNRVEAARTAQLLQLL